MIALKQQKGSETGVVKEYTQRLATALAAEVTGYSFPMPNVERIYAGLKGVGLQLMRGGNAAYIKSLQSILQSTRSED